jgi:peptidoglycan/LPS O-acetylase OafA/YrhL
MTADQHRSFYLDAVRRIAAQLVLVGHAVNTIWPHAFLTNADGVWQMRPGVFYVQDLGVMLFFAMSGYVIAMAALRVTNAAEGRVDWRRFMADRASRILLPLWPALALTLAIDWAGVSQFGQDIFAAAPDRMTTANFLASATLVANNPAINAALGLAGFEPLQPFGTNAPLWSIVIEWHLYICAIAVLVFVHARSWRTRAGALLALGFSITWIAPDAAVYSHCTFAWLAGFAWYAGRNAFERQLDTASAALIAGLALLVAAGASAESHLHLLTPVHALAIAAMLLAGKRLADLNGERVVLPTGVVRTLDATAAISYSLYLIHMPVVVWAGPWLAGIIGPFAALAAVFAAANLAATLVWFVGERRYKESRAFFYRLFGAAAR